MGKELLHHKPHSQPVLGVCHHICYIVFIVLISSVQPTVWHLYQCCSQLHVIQCSVSFLWPYFVIQL